MPMNKPMGYKKAPMMGYRKGGSVFKPCTECRSPSKCRAAGKCLAKAKK